MKKLIAILMVAVLALSLVACGSKEPADPAAAIVGTWELDDAESEEAKTAVQMMKMYGMTMTFEFKADGSGKLTTQMGEEPEVNDFTYEIKDNQIVIDGSPAEFKIEGKKLHITVDGDQLIFKKK